MKHLRRAIDRKANKSTAAHKNMDCRLKARRTPYKCAVKVKGQWHFRRFVIFKRTGSHSIESLCKKQNRQPCGNDDCRICGPFLTMVIEDIERKTPSLVAKAVSPLEKTQHINQPDYLDSHHSRPAKKSSPRARHVKKKYPIEEYRDSCLANGYDPEQHETEKSKRRMVVKEDGSEWHPRTLQVVEEFLESEGRSKLPASMKKVVKSKVQGTPTIAGSQVADAYWRAIWHCEKLARKA